jgi:hypothetical protein
MLAEKRKKRRGQVCCLNLTLSLLEGYCLYFFVGGGHFLTVIMEAMQLSNPSSRFDPEVPCVVFYKTNEMINPYVVGLVRISNV